MRELNNRLEGRYEGVLHQVQQPRPTEAGITEVKTRVRKKSPTVDEECGYFLFTEVENDLNNRTSFGSVESTESSSPAKSRGNGALVDKLCFLPVDVRIATPLSRRCIARRQNIYNAGGHKQ